MKSTKQLCRQALDQDASILKGKQVETAISSLEMQDTFPESKDIPNKTNSNLSEKCNQTLLEDIMPS